MQDLAVFVPIKKKIHAGGICSSGGRNLLVVDGFLGTTGESMCSERIFAVGTKNPAVIQIDRDSF